MLLSVRDSGIGFEINEAMHNHGIGLISMRERVGLVDGTISIDSKPMAGTEINVRIPVAMDTATGQKSATVQAQGVHGASTDLVG